MCYMTVTVLSIYICHQMPSTAVVMHNPVTKLTILLKCFWFTQVLQEQEVQRGKLSYHHHMKQSYHHYILTPLHPRCTWSHLAARDPLMAAVPASHKVGICLPVRGQCGGFPQLSNVWIIDQIWQKLWPLGQHTAYSFFNKVAGPFTSTAKHTALVSDTPTVQQGRLSRPILSIVKVFLG